MKQKKAMMIIAAAGIAIVLVGAYFFLRTSSTPVSSIVFGRIELSQSDSSVFLSGNLVASGRSYRGYNYRIDGNALIVEIKTGLVLMNHNDGSFAIELNDDRLSGVETIYIEADSIPSRIYPKRTETPAPSYA